MIKRFKQFILETADKWETIKKHKAEQIASRPRDNDFIGNELAKRDISASFGRPHDSLDGKGTIHTKVWIHADHQKEARDIIKSLGYDKTHIIASKMGSSGDWKEADVPIDRKNSSVRWTGD